MARGRQPVTTKDLAALPADVLKSDTEYPKKGRATHYLEFLHSGRFGWCIKTLPINNRGRTYGMTRDGNIVTMGGRPDDKVVGVHVTETNGKRLSKWLELREKGMGSAGDIRDRIGSRRAQGQVERAAGRSSWRWNT